MRVLVAEDSDVQRAQLAGLLRRAGHDVVEVRDGHEALRVLLEASGPRIALLDWEMPGLDGIEVCRRVREATVAVRPHLVLLTARADRDDAVEGLKAGADDFLSKPPSPGELMARLKVGQRAVETQLELLARTRALEAALGRLEAVSSLAASVRLVAASLDEPIAIVAHRKLESLVPALSVLPGPAVARAHGALVLPGVGQWVDFVIEVEGTLSLGAPLPSATASPTAGGFERLTSADTPTDLLIDLATTWLKRTAGALVGAGRLALVAAPGRSLSASAALPGCAEIVGPFRVWAATHPLEARPLTFDQLAPGLVLLAPLTPRSRTGLEVLRAGTWLTASHLERSRAFFPGDDARSEVLVGAPTPLARAAHG
ncbi:MAG: response regulator transcription factor [Myxococcaceae bacterium]|nr:response regulator transcription factor [Myxococcaceae bacterium]